MSKEAKPNYVMGRGQVSINGRYIGETSSFRFLGSHKPGHVNFAFDAADISYENLQLYFTAQLKPLVGVTVEYTSNNAVGANIDFRFVRVELSAGLFELKSGEAWQTIGFHGTTQIENTKGLFDFREG